MRIIITGALGHIGSHLIRKLPEVFPESQLLLIDNLSAQRYCSLFNLPAGNYSFVEADILTADLRPLFAGAEVVVHLAAITDATNSFKIKDQVELTNFKGTQRVASACVETGCALIFPSSTSVYGSQTETVDENCPESDLKPQTPYADSKLKAERCLEDLGRNRDLRFVNCRLGTIFGVSPGMRFHTAVNKFCWQAVMKQPITVWRTALYQKRPYLALDDATAAIEFIIKHELYNRELYNIATTNATVYEITQTIAAVIPDISIEYVDSEIMNQLSYEVISARFSSLGFEFRGDLRQGIRDTIALLRQASQVKSFRQAFSIPLTANS